MSRGDSTPSGPPVDSHLYTVLRSTTFNWRLFRVDSFDGTVPETAYAEVREP